jgi:hypothetical protein
VNSRMRVQCAVPVTPEPMQFAGGVTRGMGLDLKGLARGGDRWSARRTLLFVVATNSALWWVIAYAVRTFS